MNNNFTLCICVRNGRKYIDRCLSSLLNDSGAFHIPIIIIDHLSTDETDQILLKWQNQYPDQIKILSFSGEGLSEARDFAWRAALTPWIGFLDIDTQVIPGWTEAVLKKIQIYQEIPLIGAFGGMNQVPPKTEGKIYPIFEVLLSTYVGGHNSILNREIQEEVEQDHLPTLNVVYRRTALEVVGGFDPSFTRVGEDIDLSFRLKKQGYLLYSNPKMRVEHALRPSWNAWLKNMFLYGRGRCFYLKKHRDAFEIKFIVPALAMLTYMVLLFGVISKIPYSAEVFFVISILHFVVICIPNGVASLRRKKSAKIWLLSSLLTWLTHLFYGAGFLKELPNSSKRFKY